MGNVLERVSSSERWKTGDRGVVTALLGKGSRKNTFLVVGPLREREGVKVGPLRKRTFLKLEKNVRKKCDGRVLVVGPVKKEPFLRLP